MFSVKNKDITMIEDDYGFELPITITGTEIASDETIKMTVSDVAKEIKIEKAFTNIDNNTINFSLTQAESEKLKPTKKYTYSIDWYKGEEFLGNVVNGYEFIVEEKK